MTPASIIPVFGSQRPYADLNFAGGSFGLDGRSVSDLTALPGFTFTRASLAMGYDATGKLTYGPNNLLRQSQTFGTTWVSDRATVTSDVTTAPDGTLTADKLVEDATASNTHRATQNVTTNLFPYVLSVYAKADTRSWVYLRIDRNPSTTPMAWFNLSTGVIGTVMAGLTATMTSVGNGWYRCAVQVDVATNAVNSMIVGLSTGDGVTSYNGDGTSGLFIWGAQLEAVTYQTTPSTYYPTTTAAYYGPRLVYDPVTLASLGILVEEARTNIALQSQTFDNASWSKARATITANAATSPDGTTNADAFNEDATAASGHELVQAFTKAASAVTYTSSVFVKKGGRDWICVTNWDNSANGNRFWFNVNTGVIGSTSTFGTPFTSTSYSIQQAPNGFWRCITTFTTNTATAMALTYYSCAADGSTTPATGLNAVGLYLYQAQLEAGTGASSPIPTTTASVTRAADVARLTGLTLSYPTTLAAGFTKSFGAATSRAATFYIDGNNFTAVGLTSAGGTRLDVASGGAFQAQITGATVANGSAALVAGRVETNNVAFAAQGALAGVDTLATPPSPTTALNIGIFSDGGSEPFNGTISRIRIYNRALSDAQLQSLTS